MTKGMQWFTLAGALILLAPPIAGADVLGDRVRARYEVAYSHLKPQIDEMELAILGQEEHEGRPFTWFQLAVSEKGAHRWTCKMLLSNLDFLGWRWAPAPEVARYQFHEAGAAALEYVDIRDGAPAFPAVNFWRFLVPYAADRGGLDRFFFERGQYMGRDLTRLESDENPIDRIPEAALLRLDPDCLIGSTGVLPPETADRWRDLGATMFVVDEKSAAALLPLLREQPVYIAGQAESDDYPQLLYRGNAFNGRLALDAPGSEALALGALDGADSLYAAAQRLIGINLYRLVGARQSTQGDLRQRYQRWVFLSEPRRIEESRFPIRDHRAGIAWYQCEAGANSYVGIVRFRAEAFAARAQRALGVEVPADAETLLRLHLAFYRGAAEAFGVPWGVSLSGDLDPDARERLFPMAYDAGASFFWFESGGHGSALPLADQERLLEAFAAHREAHPRDAAALASAKANRVCIALPYGYVFDEETLAQGALWGLDRFRLVNRNETGATYGAVLARAQSEALRQWQRGHDVDFGYWGGDQPIEGYREIHRVRESGDLFPLDRSKRSPGM